MKVGTNVMIHHLEGFGGPGHVVEVRTGSPEFKCHLNNSDQPDFWCFATELQEMVVAEASKYDSRPDTWEHIHHVRRSLQRCITGLLERQQLHDQSKLVSPEVEVFNEYTPKLKHSTYGSDEYTAFLAAMKVGLDHHYAVNPHHPEHFADGMRGMSLLDLLEMLCDWKAATMRHADGDILKSVEINQKRFGYSDELKQILINTLAVI